MKNYLAAAIVALAVATSTPSSAQASDDRLSVFTAGDSITWGGPPGDPARISYPSALGNYCGDECAVKNVSHPGACLLLEDCSYPVRMRKVLREEVWPSHPDVVMVTIGTNDLGGYNPTSAFKEELRQIRADGRAAGVTVLLGTIPPARDYWPQRCEDQRLKLNRWIRTLPHIDFSAVLDTRAGELRKIYDSGDGLHPRGNGYRVMAREALRVLRSVA